MSGYIDFTNPAAAEWWYQRLQNLIDTYDIDSFKFDAGESNFSPQVYLPGIMLQQESLSLQKKVHATSFSCFQIAVQTGDIDYQPHHIVESFVRTCARFGDMIEIRAGFRSVTTQLTKYVIVLWALVTTPRRQ